MGDSGGDLTSMFASLLASSTVMSGGRAPVPTLVGLATTVIPVELKPPMPDATFAASAFITTNGVGGLNLLGTLEVQGCAVVDSSHVNVTVKNTGLVQLAGAYAVVVAVRS